MLAALTAAIGDTNLVVEPEEGTAPEAEPEPGEGAEALSSEGGTSDAGAETPAGSGSEGTSPDRGEPPESYFGLSLKDLDRDTAWAIIDRVSEQDKVIQQVQRDRAELRKQLDEQGTSAPAPKTESPTELSDEDIMRAAGYDPDDPMYDVVSSMVLPILKQVQPLRNEVQELRQARELEEAALFWDGRLTALETEHGVIPGPDGKPMSHEDIFRYAAQNNLLDPDLAYHRMTAGGRQATSEAVLAEARALIERKREQGGTVRPRTGAPVKTTVVSGQDSDGKDRSLTDVIKEAARLAEQETGFKWADTVGPGATD
jgi:hypothetical protein